MRSPLRFRHLVILCSIPIVLCNALPAHVSGEEVTPAAGHWPQWRGPLGTGLAPNADPPVEFSETKNIRWKVAFSGKGHSTPVIWSDRVLLTTAIPFGTPLKEPQYSGRPGAHDNLPVTHRHKFVAMALNRRNGEVLWQKTLSDGLPLKEIRSLARELLDDYGWPRRRHAKYERLHPGGTAPKTLESGVLQRGRIRTVLAKEAFSRGV